MFSKQYKLTQVNYELYSSKIGELPPTGSWPQPGWFGKNARIAFIGQNPGLPQLDEPFEHERNQDVYIKYVIQSPTGQIFQKILEEANLAWDDVAYTNLVKSPTPKNRVPYDYEIEYYKKYLKLQFECLDIQTFVIFGRPAVDNLLGNIPLDYSLKGVSVPWNNDTINALTMPHPSYIHRIGKVIEYTKLVSDFIKEEYASLVLRDQFTGRI